MRDGSFPFTVVSGVPVVTAPEEIDITNAPALRLALLEAGPHGHGTLAVDMTATRFCDSSGLHVLLAAHRRAQGEGGELLLVCSATAVLRVFELTALDRMIPTFTSLDQALAHTPDNGLAGRGAPAGSDQQQRPPTPAPADLAQRPSRSGAVPAARTSAPRAGPSSAPASPPGHAPAQLRGKQQLRWNDGHGSGKIVPDAPSARSAGREGPLLVPVVS